MYNLIEILINSKKIKYKILNNLFYSLITPNIDIITIFINLHEIIKNILSKNINEDVAEIFLNKSKINLSSNFINILAHYRHYFWTRFNIRTNIILYKNDNIKYNTNNIILLKNINKNFKISKLISKYIPFIYILNFPKNVQEELIILNLIKKYKLENSNNLNLIFTTDIINYQLVNLNNTHILYLNSDNSILFSKNNIFNLIMNNLKILKKFDVNISSEYLGIYASLLGNEKRNINRVDNFTPLKILKKLNELNNEKLLPEINNYVNHKLFLDLFKIEDKNLFKNNFKKIDLFYNYYNKNENYKFELNKLYSNIIDLKNQNELIKLNDKYYNRENSLMLIELFNGF